MSPELAAAINEGFDRYAIEEKLRSPLNFWFVDLEEQGLQPAPREINIYKDGESYLVGLAPDGYVGFGKYPDHSVVPPHQVDPDNYVILDHNGEVKEVTNKIAVEALRSAHARAQAKVFEGRGKSDQLLRTSEVAARFDVSERTVINWARSGKLPSLRTIGRHLRFSKSDVDELLYHNQQTAGGRKAG